MTPSTRRPFLPLTNHPRSETRVVDRSNLSTRRKACLAVFAVLVVAAALTISLIVAQQSDTEQAYPQEAEASNSTALNNSADIKPADNSAQELATLQPPKPLFFFLGDSITEEAIDPARGGYIPLLQKKVSRSADVVVHGLSGYTTRWVLKYAMPVVEDEIKSHTFTPTLITIWFGTNDAVIMNGSRAEKHVPVDSYKENLAEIVRRFQTLVPSADIMLATPPHVDDAARIKRAKEDTGKWKGVVDRSNARSGIYARACVEAAKAIGIPVLDLYSYFNAMNASTRNALLWDGLHFSPEGHEVVVELFLNKTQREFPAVAKALDSWKIISSSELSERDPWVPGRTNETAS